MVDFLRGAVIKWENSAYLGESCFFQGYWKSECRENDHILKDAEPMSLTSSS